MFNSNVPRHFLGYSASDQRTVRELVNLYHGILVPATVATFQREGTAGFVLALSATDSGPPYVIDPRFPLFQQHIPKVKASHAALADILGDQDLISAQVPRPSDFTDKRIKRIATAWVEFNLSYRTRQSAKFRKYADRLGEELDESDAMGPQRVLAPYFCVNDSSDPWWDRSMEFYDRTIKVADNRIEVTRVLATKTPQGLLDIAAQPASDNVCIWVSGLEELGSSEDDLVEYGNAIRLLSQVDRRSFALYGGFFAVALSAVGLGGCSHGIGYGEHRNWLELPRSGPPPTRYYLPTVHRYVSQEDAQQLWSHDPRLVSLHSVPRPMGLEYHDLMLHSVAARAQEIDAYRDLDLADTILALEAERDDFRRRYNARSPNALVTRMGQRAVRHMDVWIDVLKAL